MQRNKRLAFVVFILILLFIGKTIKPWSTFVPQGYPTGQIVKVGNYLIFGTNYSKIYFVNVDNDKDSSFLDLNSGDTLVQDKSGGRVVVTSGDKIFLVDAIQRKIIWQGETEGQYFFEKAKISGNMIIASTLDGNILKFSIKDGNKTVFDSPERKHNILDLLDKNISKTLLIYDEEGVITLQDNKGRTRWKYPLGIPSDKYSTYFSDTFNIYIPGANGVIYKINKYNGRPAINFFERVFDVSTKTHNIGGHEILELSLNAKGKFSNPWSEAELDVWFTNENGEKVYVPGFYYDGLVWKVRFAPPRPGVWKWDLEWHPHGARFFKSGEYRATTGTDGFYTKIAKNNSKRLTIGDENIFNGIGIEDTMLDFNYNGTQLDDWSVGSESGKTVKLDEYIKVYGPRGAGFNLFRWNIGNASPSVWLELGFPSRYSLIQGKIGDTLLSKLKVNDIHLWVTLFGNDIPYKFSNNSNEEYLLKSYAKYIFARYGVFTDIWEIGNEVAVPKKVEELIGNELKNLDFEKRPISCGSDPYNYTNGSIIAPHWYESENLWESDAKTARQIENFSAYPLPVIISEQGNKTVNFDSTSAVRMRVRSWTAFFKEGILIFWNQSDSKDVKSGVFSNANIYLGDAERKYIKSLQDFSSGFPVASRKFIFPLAKFGIRGYGLVSEKVVAGYFFHYQKPSKPAKFSVVIFTKYGGRLDWVDPSFGKIIKSQWCRPGRCKIISPSFRTDISFKLVSGHN